MRAVRCALRLRHEEPDAIRTPNLEDAKLRRTPGRQDAKLGHPRFRERQTWKQKIRDTQKIDGPTIARAPSGCPVSLSLRTLRCLYAATNSSNSKLDCPVLMRPRHGVMSDGVDGSCNRRKLQSDPCFYCFYGCPNGACIASVRKDAEICRKADTCRRSWRSNRDELAAGVGHGVQHRDIRAPRQSENAPKFVGKLIHSGCPELLELCRATKSSRLHSGRPRSS